jgi:hypothetical protein
MLLISRHATNSSPLFRKPSSRKNVSTLTPPSMAFEAHPIYSGASSIGTNKPPGMIENISPKNLVVKCIEAVGLLLT